MNWPKTVLKILFAVKIPTANMDVFPAPTTFVASSVPIATFPPKVDIPLIDNPVPTILSANTDPPVN